VIDLGLQRLIDRPRADVAERVSGLDFVLFRDPVGTRPDCCDRRARPESRKSLI
jgi:hypothetical protein